ncbi:MAG: TetR/AcrR family transcriptional regulator [Christensenellales bacterium]
MNKSESKYYNTALLMNQALIELLNKKEFEYITIKEICEKAGVNRSTFYLHYETKNDLLSECIENTNEQFVKYFNKSTKDFFDKMKICTNDELILISPEYLNPYLKYIKENKIIHQVAIKHALIMNSTEKFNSLNQHIFKPIFDKFGIDEKTEHYMIAYYINGIIAIINEWIKNDCKDEMSYIENIIINCVMPKMVENNESKRNI